MGYVFEVELSEEIIKKYGNYDDLNLRFCKTDVAIFSGDKMLGVYPGHIAINTKLINHGENMED